MISFHGSLMIYLECLLPKSVSQINIHLYIFRTNQSFILSLNNMVHCLFMTHFFSNSGMATKTTWRHLTPSGHVAHLTNHVIVIRHKLTHVISTSRISIRHVIIIKRRLLTSVIYRHHMTLIITSFL